MKFMTAIFLFAFLLITSQGVMAADQAQAKEVARINNCAPKKVEVYKQSLGSQGQTLYRIECNVPKSKGDSAPGATALLVGCDESLCQLMRPLPPDSK